MLTRVGWLVQDTASKDADTDIGLVRATGEQATAPSPLDVPLAQWEETPGAGKGWVHTPGTRVEYNDSGLGRHILVVPLFCVPG